MNKNIVLALIGTGALAGLVTIGLFQVPQNTQPTEPEPRVVEIQPLDLGIAETYQSYPDWTLSIPDIDFNQQMTEVHRQGKTLPVPDDHPGYYLPNDHHIFIVGHNNSVFSRLNEQPSTIQIWLNSNATIYNLIEAQTLPVSEIDMGSIFTYSGVVIMTCAGVKTDDGYSHRLILFYS